jgi:hypothetical protein
LFSAGADYVDYFDGTEWWAINSRDFMPGSSRKPVPLVIQQHVEEAAILRGIRTVLVHAPHVRLDHLRRLDDRLAAHLHGLAVSAEFGWRLCESALENPGVGEVFVVAVRAIEDKNSSRLDKSLALAEALPEAQSGLISAFGWVSARILQELSVRNSRVMKFFVGEWG